MNAFLNSIRTISRSKSVKIAATALCGILVFGAAFAMGSALAQVNSSGTLFIASAHADGGSAADLLSCVTNTSTGATYTGYYYYQNADQMISAYCLPQYDNCADPTYTIGGTNYWFRQGGRDTATCQSLTAASSATSTLTCTLSASDFEADLYNGLVGGSMSVNAGSSTASFVFTNKTNCSVPIGLSSFKVFFAESNPNWLGSQQLFDVTSSPAVAPSSTQTFVVKTANCRTQVDGWYGQQNSGMVPGSSLYDLNGYPTIPFVFSYTSANDGNLCGATSTLPSADLSIGKSVDNRIPHEGDTVHYVVTVSALGPATSTGVVATDVLPSGLNFVSATSSRGIYASSTGLWSIGDMSASSTATLSIGATVNSGTAGTTIANSATVSENASSSDPNGGNNGASSTITVATVPPVCTTLCAPATTSTLAITVSGLQNGATSTITVSDATIATSTAIVMGNGTSSAVLHLNDQYAATGSAIGYSATTSASCAGTFSVGTTCTVTFSLTNPPQATLAITPTVLPNGTTTVSYLATLNATGTAVGPFTWSVASGTLPTGLMLGTSTIATTTISGTPTATGTYPFAIRVTNGTTTAVQAYTVLVGTPPACGTSGCADIAIAKTVDNANPVGGSTINYTLTATALGPATSTNVVAHDVLPAGLSFSSASSSQGVYNLTTGDWNIGTLSPNTTSTLTLSVFVGTQLVGQTLANTATISQLSSFTDTNPGNNSSSVSITVRATSTPFLANLGVTKTVDNANPNTGDLVHYLITITDAGPASSTGVVATDTLPINLTLINATTSQGTYASSTGTWLVGNMQVNATATLAIAARVDASSGTTIVNTVNVEGTPDPSASATLTVATPPVTPPVTPPNNGGGGGGGGGGSISLTFTLAIDGGASTTATTSAELSLYGTYAYRMEVSNDPNFTDSSWITYVTDMPWVLTPGLGNKTVFVRYRDVNGKDIGAAQASIVLVGPGSTTTTRVSQGQVLGASITCGLYMRKYVKYGADNDPFEVRKLQVFLSQNLGEYIPATGYYDSMTHDALSRFQLKYRGMVLRPWIPYGLPNEDTSTGYSYKTTTWQINMLVCPPLELSTPQLP